LIALSSIGLSEWAEAEPDSLTLQAMEAVTARGAYLEPWGNGKQAWEVALGCSGPGESKEFSGSQGQQELGSIRADVWNISTGEKKGIIWYK
jgi:hypothetical protein